jgi:hypothetical protein
VVKHASEYERMIIGCLNPDKSYDPYAPYAYPHKRSRGLKGVMMITLAWWCYSGGGDNREEYGRIMSAVASTFPPSPGQLTLPDVCCVSNYYPEGEAPEGEGESVPPSPSRHLDVEKGQCHAICP